ncbi:DUF7521 family protein [Natrarchaeobius oligotrophus]|uniref:Uncharacterized protein n=1 Tax=Natrarchaeobius chitinivorans TaxID=1679083 RepID=A0A3N6M8A3_NATCH|nr:hypothetical protein [Natrarchaeobius chitinivorans]RQG98547.1 hypothetical protein EA472_17225 [Natrarchaeobius chitinivorans]
MVAVDPAVALFVTALLTAVAGVVVAGYAYRGYQRNDSAVMFYLSIGIALIAVGPVVVSYGLAPLFSWSDAVSLLGVLWVTIAGLVSILYSLEGT